MEAGSGTTEGSMTPAKVTVGVVRTSTLEARAVVNQAKVFIYYLHMFGVKFVKVRKKTAARHMRVHRGGDAKFEELGVSRMHFSGGM